MSSAVLVLILHQTLLNFMQVSSLPLILNTKWAQVARMVFEIEGITVSAVLLADDFGSMTLVFIIMH